MAGKRENSIRMNKQPKNQLLGPRAIESLGLDENQTESIESLADPIETLSIKIESVSAGKFKVAVSINTATREADDVLSDVLRLFEQAQARTAFIMKAAVREGLLINRDDSV